MPFDYLANFPLPAAELPAKLLELLAPESMAPTARIVVAARQDFSRLEGRREFLQLAMALVPAGLEEPIRALPNSDALVASSTPIMDEFGGLSDYNPTLEGCDYVVAAWGDGSFYNFHLAEKVWMALGLTSRCIGGEDQRLIYDDLSTPEFAIAEGEASTEYEHHLKRDVLWKMSNARLRNYLWARGAIGTRVFFYETLLTSTPGLRDVMQGDRHKVFASADGWCEVDLREHDGGLFLQVWATVAAVTPERCAETTADGLIWPGHGAISRSLADAMVAPNLVYLDDRFLERYEQNAAYDSCPSEVDGRWFCSPSYRGQWNFTDCVRVGRNLVRVPLRELYKPKPDQEIIHAHQFVVDPQLVSRHDRNQEHIASKTQRLLDAFLDLADRLVILGRIAGREETAIDLTKISRVELRANGWTAYPQLQRLAQVAPLDMSQQAFLSRCKSVHEFSQVLPNGYLKDLLEKAGVPRPRVSSLGTLKLLQGILNVVQSLNANLERADAFLSDVAPEGWDIAHAGLAGLFVTNDLRIADAHEVPRSLSRLEALDFDLATTNEGYGLAIDLIFDRVIESFRIISAEIQTLQER